MFERSFYTNDCFHSRTMAHTASPRSTVDTRTELLNAAERIFAEKGYDASSLRAITQQAGANLASINYHFGSKQGLLQEVFRRRLRPLNELRVERLRTYLDHSRDRLELRPILRAFVDTVLAVMHGPDFDQSDFVRILARTIIEPGGPLQEMLLDEFKEVIREFSAAFAQALPLLSQEELAWRFHFMVGALAHTLASGHIARQRLVDRPTAEQNDLPSAIERLVDFLEAGWRAPAAGQSEPQP